MKNHFTSLTYCHYYYLKCRTLINCAVDELLLFSAMYYNAFQVTSIN